MGAQGMKFPKGYPRKHIDCRLQFYLLELQQPCRFKNYTSAGWTQSPRLSIVLERLAEKKEAILCSVNGGNHAYTSYKHCSGDLYKGLKQGQHLWP